jgi:hypothetical protein
MEQLSQPGDTKSAMARRAGLNPEPRSRAWYLLLLVLTTWQGWLTLSLFGGDHPWERLLDDQPVMSGRHPLHLYHGYLGSLALYARGTQCCFDPCFQAGYPKTPIFDSGSRPAEWFLLLAGVAYRPAAYKVGLALCCLAVPLLLAAAVRGAGLGRAGTCLATAIGQIVWWGVPCRSALEAGDLDFLIATTAALAQAGLLLRFDRAPGVGTWLGLLLVSYLGWFTQPLLFALLVPLVLIYYLSVGARHGVFWHLALLGSLAGAIAANGVWLADWLNFWWLRAPLQIEARLLSHRTLRTLWEAPFWGSGSDRFLAVVLLSAGLVGVLLLNWRRQRAAARLLGLGAAGFLALSLLGITWEPLGRTDAARLLIPALFFAVAPAVYAFVEALRWCAAWTGGPWRAAFVAGSVLLIAGFSAREFLTELADRFLRTTPFEIGLGDERQALVTALEENTTNAGRILWEDRPGQTGTGRWSALLPLLTERAYLGGLDGHAGIEHDYVGFAEQWLAGRRLRDWTDAELDEFCRRYNVGWVVCWSPTAIERFRAWTSASAMSTLRDEGEGYLFAVHRPLSFALKGQARWLHADSRHVALGDVVPEDGKVVLSLHYQTGLQATPSQVQVERELDPYDPVPFVRLHMSGPVTRVILTWENR